MIGNGFNSDANFTNKEIDINELNDFINEKRKEATKEMTKYDVDNETRARGHRL